ncbi:MAG TPA: nuclear transport factor 2 family protein [Polyangia bacterium]|jgi:ketosteroid isomerase-like protein|nr:nuclear transport factor 2 family protein [Polyangia bacterium]
MKNDSAQAPQDRFPQAIARAEEAARQLLRGDPAPFRQLYSHKDDVTLYGGEGGRLQGFAAISHQLDWLAQKTQHGGAAAVEFEYLLTHAGSELGYTIGTQHVRPQGSPTVFSLRVTHIYRYEDGDWRLVHRHGDPRVDMDPSNFDQVYRQE